MTKEETLRLYILDKYLTLLNFAEEINMSPTTLTTILKRGLESCSSNNLFKICDELNISIDALRNGRIIPLINPKDDSIDIEKAFITLAYKKELTIDGKPLTNEELHIFASNLELSLNIIKRNRNERMSNELNFSDFEFD